MCELKKKQFFIKKIYGQQNLVYCKLIQTSLNQDWSYRLSGLVHVNHKRNFLFKKKC